MAAIPNGFNAGSNGGAYSFDGSADNNDCRQLVHTLRKFGEALTQAIDAFEPVNGSQNEPGNFYDLVSAFETDLIRKALRKTNGHQGRAAQMLGLRTTTLNTMIKRLKLSVW